MFSNFQISKADDPKSEFVLKTWELNSELVLKDFDFWEPTDFFCTEFLRFAAIIELKLLLSNSKSALLNRVNANAFYCFMDPELMVSTDIVFSIDVFTEL